MSREDQLDEHHPARALRATPTPGSDAPTYVTEPQQMNVVLDYARGLDYPATRQDLLDAAERRGAPFTVLETLRRIPVSQFEGPEDVRRALAQTP